MKKTIIYFSLIVIGFCTWINTSSAQDARYDIAPTTLPDITNEMKTPGFWISRHPEPDKEILSQSEIMHFNETIQSQYVLTKNILNFPDEISGEKVNSSIYKEINDFRRGTYYLSNRTIPDKEYYQTIEDNLNLNELSRIVKVRFGLIVYNADQRMIPITEGLYAKPGDIDFDEVQNNALDIGTPVAVLHESKDKKWFYVMGPSSDGWIKSENIALIDKNELLRLWNHADYVVVTSAKADVYLNPEKTQYYGFARMGSKFICYSADDISKIILPVKNKEGQLELKEGYVNKEDIHYGFLLYTPRNIYQQAFKLLNTPYGWGGMNGEQDCSQFIQEIFSTVGIQLPRNSSDQAKTGEMLKDLNESMSEESKQNIVIKNAIPGISLLYMKGHILLYLGHVANEAFAIHDIWAYREPGESEDIIRVINRVAVTNLFLGNGSKKTSLLKRLKSVLIIR